MRGDAMAKSTFVTAPSFASSGSVTSINHVPHPRPLQPLDTLAILAYTHCGACPIAAHPIFRHRPVLFPFYQFLPFFLLRSCTRRPRACPLAHIIPEVHSSGKNEILRTTLLRPRRVSSALVIVRGAWIYVASTHDDYA